MDIEGSPGHNVNAPIFLAVERIFIVDGGHRTTERGIGTIGAQHPRVQDRSTLAAQEPDTANDNPEEVFN
jgi:hypothetical protein